MPPEDHDELPELPPITLGPNFVLVQNEFTGGIAEVHKDAVPSVYTKEKGWRVVKVFEDPSSDVTVLEDVEPLPDDALHPEVELPPDADDDGAGTTTQPPVLHPEV